MPQPNPTTALTDLAALYHRLGLSEQAIRVVEMIRRSNPARAVRGGRSNVISRYPSRKMGVTVQAESHKVELAAIYSMEYDETVLEFYDQPPSFPLSYPTPSGRKASFLYTSDFFVIRQSKLGWEEWKTEAELKVLAIKMPHRYVATNGGWTCPPAEQYANQYGFYFRVRSDREINRVLLRNLIFLEDYRRLDPARIPIPARQEISKFVRQQPGIVLHDLLSSLKQATADDLYGLLLAKEIYVRLEVEALAEPEHVHLFANAATAQANLHLPLLHPTTMTVSDKVLSDQDALDDQPRRNSTGIVSAHTYTSNPNSRLDLETGSVLLWDGVCWEVLNVGTERLTLRSAVGKLLELTQAELLCLLKQGSVTSQIGSVAAQTIFEKPGAIQELLNHSNPQALQEATRRFRLIEPFINGQKVDATKTGTVVNSVLGYAETRSQGQGVSQRTLYLWLNQYRQAQTSYGPGYGFVGLLPRIAQRGNRQAKLPQATIELTNSYITKHYETIKHKGASAVYGQLLLACETAGLTPPSFKTFCLALKKRPVHEQTQKRQGHRAAYKYEPPYLELEPTTPRHGDYPFQLAHLDHTELDVELISAKTGHNLGRPWASFLTDAFTRRLLAVYLSYDAPSYRACMMILRECVRRHVRLPQVLVVDGGAEFHSTYFEVFLARYEVTKKTRPPAQARFGSVAERLFGTANTNFIHNLQGNTQITRNVRQVTKSVNPKEQAVWTLARLYDRLCEWAYEVYDTTPHPALGQSPRQAHNTGLITAGSRPNRLISYNQDFILDTLPTTLKGTAKVHIRDGVKINGIYYWSDDFRHPEVEGTNVPVRYDPYDAGITYAFVRGSWVKTVSEYYGAFKGRSEKEVLLASAELRKKLGSTAKGQKLTAKTRATFLNSLEAEEALMLQRQRDGEFESILSRLAGNEPLPAISGGNGEAENTGQVPLTASVTRDRVEATLAEATNNTSPNSHEHQTQSTNNPSSTKNSHRPRIIYEDY